MSQRNPLVEVECPACRALVRLLAQATEIVTRPGVGNCLQFRCPSCGVQADKVISEEAMSLLQRVQNLPAAEAGSCAPAEYAPIRQQEVTRFLEFLEEHDHLAALAEDHTTQPGRRRHFHGRVRSARPEKRIRLLVVLLAVTLSVVLAVIGLWT